MCSLLHCLCMLAMEHSGIDYSGFLVINLNDCSAMFYQKGMLSELNDYYVTCIHPDREGSGI